MADRVPKPAEQRRRRNKPAVRPEKLVAGAAPSRRPDLPGADVLSPSTVEWWATVWASPMAAIWLEADVPALVRLAHLMELAFAGEASAAILSEIRQLEDRFGLSPLARRRLQWEIEQTGAAEVPKASEDARWLRVV